MVVEVEEVDTSGPEGGEEARFDITVEIGGVVGVFTGAGAGAGFGVDVEVDLVVVVVFVEVVTGAGAGLVVTFCTTDCTFCIGDCCTVVLVDVEVELLLFIRSNGDGVGLNGRGIVFFLTHIDYGKKYFIRLWVDEKIEKKRGKQR